MLFNSLEFVVVFLPVVLAIFAFLQGRESRKYFIIFASMVFYAWWDPRFIILLTASIAGNYIVSLIISRTQGQARKASLAAGLALNLGLLGYFKYADFLIENFARIFGVEPALLGIALPLAISFFTFQQIAFLIDQYSAPRHDVRMVDYVFFVAFFPQLVAGPIVHHSEIFPQLSSPRAFQLRLVNLRNGFVIATIGLVKKVVLADSVAVHADRVFSVAGDHTLGAIEAWIGALAFGLQIYFDFSAYSDIAVGVALMFGIVLPLNFLSPYKAGSIIEFWRRWHITLSRFLRQYLYFSLGGNRLGERRRYLNIFVVMLIGGLWHGAGWNFVIWGVLHGCGLAFNHGWRALSRNFDIGSRVGKIAAWALTFSFVTAAWVPFRSPDLASTLSIYQSMIGLNGVGLEMTASGTLLPQALTILGVALGVVLLMPNIYELMSGEPPFDPAVEARSGIGRIFAFGAVRVVVGTLALTLSLVFLLDEPTTFIYFQF